ncbi:MAG: hypothetical protein Q8P30_01465 [Candidatus Uhrbacteria bacterium]|nr:hypothetical protein [Candidatus Uhrbacteria bacterium]
MHFWRKVVKAKGLDGLATESRGKAGGGGRPKTKNLIDAEKIERPETTVAYLKVATYFNAMANWANIIENAYGLTKGGSLQGRVKSGIQQAGEAGVAAATGGIGGVLLKAGQTVAGQTNKNKQKALDQLVDFLRKSDDLPKAPAGKAGGVNVPEADIVGDVTTSISKAKEAVTSKTTLQNFDSKIIDDYFGMEKGWLIDNVDDFVLLGDELKIRNRIIKHITEQRKLKDGMSSGQIKEMFDKIPSAIKEKDFEIPNPSKTGIDGSILVGKFYPEENRGLIIIKDSNGSLLDVFEEDVSEILNAFFKNKSGYKKLKNKSKN